MLVIRCKNCGTQLEEHPSQLRCCQCSNLTSIRGGNISALDLSLVEMITGGKPKRQEQSVLTKQDLEFQEQRRQRKVNRKLLDSVEIK